MPNKEVSNLWVQAIDLQEAGKYEEAFEKLDKALDIDPDWTWGYKLLAELFELWGDPDEAAGYWEYFHNNYVPSGH